MAILNHFEPSCCTSNYPSHSVPIPILVKITIPVANILADLIISTPLQKAYDDYTLHVVTRSISIMVKSSDIASITDL